MIPALKFQLRQSVTTKLADLTQDFMLSLTSNQSEMANWQAIATDLRDSVAGSVRSISHELWEQKPHKSLPKPTPLEIAQVLVSTILLRKDINAELESKIEPLKVVALSTELLTLRFSKDLAKYLHGNLQSRLMAISFGIETAGKQSDYAQLSVQLVAAQRAIESPFDHFFEAKLESLSAEITKLTHAWDALISTTLLNFGNDDQVSELDSRAMILCIEEGLSNAFHHGHATAVAIQISTTDRMHAISMTDNGIGPRVGVPGLGYSLFDSSAGTNWLLRRGPDGIGSQLTLQIPRQ